MLKLNLVPEIIKERMEFNRVYSAIRGMSFIFIFLFLFIAGLYTVTAITLGQELSYITKDSPLEKAEEREYVSRPKEINKQLEQIQNIQAESFSYVLILKNVNKYIPAGINLTSMNLDTQNNTLKLAGVADTRQDLLDLQERLENAPFLSAIEVPLQNFLEKTMISFSVNAKLDANKLNNN